jgi:F-box interacting protein
MPLFEKPGLFIRTLTTTFGFGYDSSNDNYKVVVLHYDWFNETEVKVHTLGTDIWRTIQQYPFRGVPVPLMEGKFVSGTINWLFSEEMNWVCPRFIVSFDLAKESYQKISPPNFGGVDVCDLSALAVLRDCLCVATYGNDVWIMKEYGNKESWTKLFTISYMKYPSNSCVYAMPVYIFEDDQLLLKFKGNAQVGHSTLVLYDPRSSTLKDTKLENIPEVYGESLISPCSLC